MAMGGDKHYLLCIAMNIDIPSTVVLQYILIYMIMKLLLTFMHIVHIPCWLVCGLMMSRQYWTKRQKLL